MEINPKTTSITYWGHASISINNDGYHLVMDPVLDEPFEGGNAFFNPSRKINISKMPHIDAIYISHGHGDHFDKPTLKYFSKYQPQVFCPDDPFIFNNLNNYGFKNIKKLEIGSSPKTGQLVGITFHTPQDFYCQEQNESSLYYKTPQYNQSTLFLSHLN